MSKRTQIYMRKLFLINCRQPMVDAFAALGCEIRCVRSAERELDVPAKLAELDFEPDLIFQQEILGLRLFLRGLHRIKCIKIFWSIDTHLNMHWHGLYGSLFDGVLTTQKRFVARLEKICAAKICWVPWMGARPGTEIGTDDGIIPFSKRKHNLTFVGRVSKERRSRQWFVDLLKSNYNLYLVDGLNYSEMMATYRQTRIVPNEAIFGEINFRLFEACSCGCAMVTPDIGDELGELFEIGKEIEIYNDALELKEVLDRFQRDPSYAASLALSGYERVLRDHLPANRASRILDFAGSISARSVESGETELLECLVDAALGEVGDPEVDWDVLTGKLLALKMDMRRDSALLRIFAKAGMHESFMQLVHPYLTQKLSCTDVFFSLSASLGAVKLGMWDVAKHFWYSYSVTKGSGEGAKPQSEADLLVLWGDELFKNGLAIRSGVTFNETKDIPSCASDCFFAALYLQPKGLEIYKKLDFVFSGVKGAEPSRLGFLSHISLHNPDDWRVSLEVGIANLKVFRISEGISELENARKAAAKSGNERFFKRKVESDLPLYFRLVYNK